MPPPDLSVYLPRLAARRPPLLLRDKAGYRLEGTVRRVLDAKYGDHPTTVAVAAVLSGLPDLLPQVAEKAFLKEALACYRVGAFRASIVMVWNLTFDHARNWVHSDTQRLQTFNHGIVTRFPKKNLAIVKLDDFDDLKESEFIDVCRTSGLLHKNVCDIMRDKLTRINHAAHPSTVTITQHQADDAITDLVNNVILKL